MRADIGLGNNRNSSEPEPRREFEEEVRGQLVPLFSDFYTRSPTYNIYFKHAKQIRDRIKKGMGFADSLSKIIGALRQGKGKLDLKTQTTFSALSYLTLVESVGSVCIDAAILLLIAKGRDLHLEPDFEHRYTRHATSLEDLESPTLPLSTKLDFLELNGLPFFSKWIDRPLRNRIAHMDFEVDEKGKLFIPPKKEIGARTVGRKKKYDIVERSEVFVQYFMAFAKVFFEETGKVTPPP